MIKTQYFLLGIAALGLSASAIAQSSQPSAMLLAQATDRCMATIASRQLGTADDETIFQNATEACEGVATELEAAIRREYAPDDADEILEQMSQQRRPNFINMLRAIESQRAARNSDLRERGLLPDENQSEQ